MSLQLAPIAFFCFNRADKTKLVLEELAKNDLAKDSDIYIFCDGPRNIKDLHALKEVHSVIDAIQGFRNIYVTKREINHGVKPSIVSGITQVLDQHERVIVIEDDIVTSKDFLKFINQSLEFYKEEKNIWCVAGFNYPKNIITYPENYQEDIFFIKGRNCAWGWGTWKDRWSKIDFEISDFNEFIKDKKAVKEFNKAGGNMAEMLRLQKEGKINTWDIQMSYTMFKNNGYTMLPIKPLTKNIGFDNSGTHTVGDLDLTSFEFEDFSNFKLKKLAEISNNYLAEIVYFGFHKDKCSLLKWCTSKKKLRSLKWMAAGILLGVLLSKIF